MNRYRALRPLLFLLPAEPAHHLALKALQWGLVPAPKREPTPVLAQHINGLHFPNPVGLAAGFDKNAVALSSLLAQGFGFVEAGTLTPKPQTGNPKPRLFRLREDCAVINRLGFNNAGMHEAAKRLAFRPAQGVVGINIGKNKDSTDAVADYVTGLKNLSPWADYITINISSPNTQGLRDLQQAEALTRLLDALLETRAGLKKPLPLWLKIAPDLAHSQLNEVVKIALEKSWMRSLSAIPPWRGLSL